MLKLTLRGVFDHKIRFALTAFAVVLGVAFVVASFVISDGLSDTFDEIVEGINADLDAEVRAATDFDDGTGLGTPIDESVLEVVASVDGVDEASPVLDSLSIVPLDADGDPLQTGGAPITSFNYDESTASAIEIVDGQGPGPGEFAVDLATAADDGYEVGQTYDVVTSSGRESFQLAGTFRFGDDDVLAGASLLAFDLGDLQRMTNLDDRLQRIQVIAADGVSPTELVDRLSVALPDGVEAVRAEVATSEDQDDFGAIVDVLRNALLGFAGVSVFVSAFLINNTFNIVLGQRVRELALLRAVGASARQVRVAVLGESLLVGVVATVVGIAGGVALAFGLRSLLGAFGFDLPTFGLRVSPVALILAVVVGIGVTMLASITPSRRASRVPPVAAMSDGFVFGGGEGRRRTLIGASLFAVGVIALLVGLSVSFDRALTQLLYLAAGAIGVFVGVTLLSPLFSGPAARMIGAPLRWIPWLGVSGRLARENSSRNTQRTAATAGALMIGLALVGTVSTAGESLKVTFRATLDSAIEADFYVSGGGFGVPFGSGLAEQIDASPSFDRVTPFRFGRADVGGLEKDVFAADLAELDGLIDPDVVDGSLADAGPGDILVQSNPAGDRGLAAGDVVDVAYADGDTEQLRVAAIYDDATILGDWTIDLSSWQLGRFSTTDDVFVAAAAADGVELAEAAAEIDAIAASYPQVSVETADQFAVSQESQIDSFLAIVNGMLAFAVLIALLGIANTLALSVFERTREIGLLRAVGMSRRQTRSMVRWEAAIVAIFGALLGVALGIIFGYAVVVALPDSVVNDFAVPVGTLVTYVVIAGIAGLIAAIYPARRASRLDVLDAISHR